MLLRYDFHLHTCLSPCGDDDMSPYNLVNMAAILGLQAIAVTDHNSVRNCRSALEASVEAGIIVIPGMELCTAEEIHVVCLFPDIGAAERFGELVYSRIPPIKNKPSIYGRQLVMDSTGGIIGEEELLLVTAASIGISEVPGIVNGMGGFCYPAHIDRGSFSILSNLGAITSDMGFTCVEVTPDADLVKLTVANPDLASMRIIRSSDAHYLENMREAADRLEVSEDSAAAIIEALRDI